MRYLIILAFLLTPALASAQSSDGINRLNAISTLKANEANDEALKGADKQRNLTQSQKDLRDNLTNTDRVRGFDTQQNSSPPAGGLGSQEGANLKTRHDTVKNSISNVRRVSNKAELEQIEAQLKDIQRRLDGLSEMGAEDQEQLKKMMDRMDKMEKKISNLMKKASDTANSITQNLK